MKTPQQCIVVFDMIMLSGVFVLLLFLCQPSIAIVIKAYYKANPLHDDKLFNDSLLLEAPSNSLGNCNSICGPNCIYFGFNFKQEKCRVHYTTELTNAAMEAEWRYYAPYEPIYKCKLTVFQIFKRCSYLKIFLIHFLSLLKETNLSTCFFFKYFNS